jgi:hypothetical protein
MGSAHEDALVGSDRGRLALAALSLWIAVRAQARDRAYRQFDARFQAAVVRARGCPHTRTVDVWPTPSPVPGQPPIAEGPMRKCRQCWAIEVDGVWTPHIIPPPPEPR